MINGNKHNYIIKQHKRMNTKEILNVIVEEVKAIREVLKPYHLNCDSKCALVGISPNSMSKTMNTAIKRGEVVERNHANSLFQSEIEFEGLQSGTKNETLPYHYENASSVQSSINNAQSEGKDTLLSSNDIRVLEFISNGSRSVIEITNALKLPDPRSNIRYLRNAGIPIGDYWVKSTFSRFKKYFYKGGIKYGPNNKFQKMITLKTDYTFTKKVSSDIKAMFNAAVIQNKSTPKLSLIERKQIERLHYLGEMFAKEARLLPEEVGFEDSTGNLVSSIGYMIFNKGVEVHSNYKVVGEGAEGAQLGKEIARKLGSLSKRSPMIVVTAGLDCAFYLEVKGRVVLHSVESFTQQELPKMMFQLLTNIEKENNINL